MNGFNLSDIIDAKLGGTSLSAIYFGLTKLWPTAIDYSKEYLTIESLEDNNNIYWHNGQSSAPTKTIYYSTDKSTWNSVSSSYYSSGKLISTLNTGDKIYIKGTNSAYATYNTYTNFSSSKLYKVYGNIMSLIYGDNFIGQTSISSYALRSLFTDSNIMDAKNLILSATTLAENCYNGMFLNCTSLTTAPQLPATTLAKYCYKEMFYYCTSLTTAPELPAASLKESCYQEMFEGCTSLTTAPELPATTLANYCYQYMFAYCKSLNYIKAMFTTTPGGAYTNNWVQGVAASGTFVKNSAATWNVTGVNGIPSGWTVINV